MAKDLRGLLTDLIEKNEFGEVAMNSLAQFGTRTRRYLGAELLPEMLKDRNIYRETQIRYQTVIANDGTRYSPSQYKKGKLVGEMLVELGHSDIKSDISAQEYDTLIEYLDRNMTMQGAAQLIDFADVVLNRALIEHNEKQRWEAIVAGQVVRKGDGGYQETVTYPNPSGHRINAAGTWSSDAYDPFDGDILPALDKIQQKGLQVNRIITSTPVKYKLLRNEKVRQQVLGSSEFTSAITPAQMQGYFAQVGLPMFETYDLTYRYQTTAGTATEYFLPRNAMVFACTTERDMEIVDTDENLILMPNLLGYTAIGRAAGQSAPGRVLRVEAFDSKPPRVEGEAWQASIPVIAEPEALLVIGSIS